MIDHLLIHDAVAVGVSRREVGREIDLGVWNMAEVTTPFLLSHTLPHPAPPPPPPPPHLHQPDSECLVHHKVKSDELEKVPVRSHDVMIT